jgi:putative transposase
MLLDEQEKKLARQAHRKTHVPLLPQGSTMQPKAHMISIIALILLGCGGGEITDPDVNEANRQLQAAIKDWDISHTKLAAWAQDNLAQSLAIFGLRPEHRVRMHTTNRPERLNKEIKRRTREATLFPNSTRCLRLVSAILAKQDEEWMSSKIYLNIKS